MLPMRSPFYPALAAAAAAKSKLSQLFNTPIPISPAHAQLGIISRARKVFEPPRVPPPFVLRGRGNEYIGPTPRAKFGKRGDEILRRKREKLFLLGVTSLLSTQKAIW